MTCLFISYDVIGGSSANNDLKTYIKKSDLVVHFKLIDKYSKKESMLKTFSFLEYGEIIEKDKISTGIYTTYTFDIIEVLSGSYNEKTIDVKMSGGCYGGICATVSIGYDYSLAQEGVIFLKYDKTSGNYFSYAATFSAYKVGPDNILFRGEFGPSIQEIIKSVDYNKGEKPSLTLNKLKKMIFHEKNNRSVK